MSAGGKTSPYRNRVCSEQKYLLDNEEFNRKRIAYKIHLCTTTFYLKKKTQKIKPSKTFYVIITSCFVHGYG